jgi:hypothetical protein
LDRGKVPADALTRAHSRLQSKDGGLNQAAMFI